MSKDRIHVLRRSTHNGRNCLGGSLGNPISDQPILRNGSVWGWILPTDCASSVITRWPTATLCSPEVILSENRVRLLRRFAHDGRNCLASLGAVVLSTGSLRAGALHVGNAFRARTVCVGDAVQATTVRVGTLRGAGFLSSEWNRDCDGKNDGENDTGRVPTRLPFAR